MSDSQTDLKSTFRRDFLWYFLGSMLPMLIGFVKTPIFTRYFDKESFGQLGIVTITFSFIGMLLFSWINSCLWRFYSRYKESDNLTLLYTNLFFLFVVSLALSGLISTFWYTGTKTDLIKQLIFFSFLQLVFNQLFLAYMVVIRLKGWSKYYTIVQSFRALLGLLAVLVLVFYFNTGITALVIGLAGVDAFFSMVLIVLNPAKLKLALKKVDKLVLVELLQYGSMGLIVNICLLSISYSDRYIIAMFYSLEEVGIYDQVSKISQLSVLAMIGIYFNTINPKLLGELETDFKGSISFIHKYLYPYVLLGFPFVVYLAIFSKEIATLLLGVDFRAGYILMPFIFMATFIHGLANFFELRLKFSNQLKRLGLIVLVTALLNILLNLILVSKFGYHWAAYTTMLSYMIMLVFFYFGDKQLFNLRKGQRLVLMKISVLLTIQYLTYVNIVDKLNPQIEIRIVLGFIFALMYFLFFRKPIINLRIPTN